MNRQILTLDIGNSFVKMALFNNNEMVEKFIFKSIAETLEKIKTLSYNKGIACSVSTTYDKLGDLKNFIFFNHQSKIPIKNLYKTPETLGLDRLAAAVGAHLLYPQKNVLVIDCGTCITYDYVNANAEYLGGGISPGFDLRFKALNNLTARLPLVKGLEAIPLIGNTTESSIKSGVINGVIAEITEIINRYKNINDNLALVFCGGDAQFVTENLNTKDIQIESELVLKGLNEIAKLNA